MKYNLFILIFIILSIMVPAATIRVAVVDASGGGGGTKTVTQLNDDTYYDFSASLLTPGDVDTLAELQNYDVVIIGGSGHQNSGWTSAMASTLRTWVEGGGGLLGTGWYIHERSNKSSDIKANLGAVMPGDPNVGYGYTSSGSILYFTGGSHPITNGLSSFAPGSNHVEINTAAMPSSDLLLGYTNASTGNKALMVRDSIGSGGGRSVYLGVQYLASDSYNTTSLRSGSPDRLLEQTISWLANGGGSVVVPALSVSNTNFGNVRVGTSESASITVSNTGDSGSTLAGSIGAASGSEFLPVSGTQSFSLAQGQNASRSFTYTPNARGADSTTVSITSNATNPNVTLTGTGVSPVYSSSIVPGNTIDFGTVDKDQTITQSLTIQNITTDADLGNLTNLTLLSATISGTDASYFSLSGFTPGTVLSKGNFLNLLISVSNPDHLVVNRQATLTILTDENAAFGIAGNVYTYQLAAYTVPEPSTYVFLGIAIFFLGICTKKRE